MQLESLKFVIATSNAVLSHYLWSNTAIAGYGNDGFVARDQAMSGSTFVTLKVELLLSASRLGMTPQT